jgi:hypothetical protein
MIMDATQKGTTLKIAFGSYVYTGYVPENISVSYPNGNIKVIRGANGETLTKILMDPGMQVTGSFIILGATGSIIPPAQGATVTLTPPTGTSTAYYCESAETVFSAEETKLTLTLIKEDSMTYT